MGMSMPETCWAVFKWQVINLRSCCIWLVDSVESMMMHGLANPKFTNWHCYTSPKGKHLTQQHHSKSINSHKLTRLFGFYWKNMFPIKMDRVYTAVSVHKWIGYILQRVCTNSGYQVAHKTKLWTAIFVGRQHRTCIMSSSQHLQFWGDAYVCGEFVYPYSIESIFYRWTQNGSSTPR